jgi:hypothetical protein
MHGEIMVFWADCLLGQLTPGSQLQGRRVHSPNLGHVPRKVGLYGHLLEFCRGPICEPFCHLTSSRLLVLINNKPLTDLCLLGRLYGLTRTGEIQVFNAHVHRAFRHLDHRLLRVRRQANNSPPKRPDPFPFL